MNKFNIVKLSFLLLFSAFMMVLSGCSSLYKNGSSNARPLPKIPEIAGRRTVKKPQKVRARTSVKRYPKKASVKPRSKNRPKVKQYTITSKSSTVITKSDAVSAKKRAEQQAEQLIAKQQAIKAEAKKRATVEVDPYASIPDNSSSKNSVLMPPAPPTKSVGSLAVKSLMNRARADLAIGRTQSAVSLLERGLRIESQNSNIWHLLAKAHHNQSDHQQAITMAKKSIRYASEDKLIAQNWQLIKKAGEKSDDTIAIKEALDYFKVNP